MSCPLCGGTDLASTVARDRVPVLQNRVYGSREQAVEAPAGRFDLVQCRACGFAHNAAFDPSLAVYDEHYDNQVPSAVMDAHYRKLVDQLVRERGIERGLLVDVGCGKGTFLMTASEMLPEVRGLGIDPSYVGDPSPCGGRLRFVADRFHAAQLTESPSLVVCRHVLEHLPQPVQFVASLHTALAAYPDVPLFFEVPDLSWIVSNNAFWDFCYEHCNYFDASTLSAALRRGGFAGSHESGACFGEQYLWIRYNPTRADAVSGSTRHVDLVAYAEREASALANSASRLEALAGDGYEIVVWGMATKGVMFVNLLDPMRQMVDRCVDINTAKQGAYVPLTGHLIEPPQALRNAAATKLAVVVMNPNYAREIGQACESMGLRALLIDANGTHVA
jgi:Methyltransferase domain/C-methyltransferase C-terminal domain